MGEGQRTRWCQYDECENLEHKGGFCWTHAKRRSRKDGKPERVQVRLRPWANVIECAIQLVEVDPHDDRAYRAAEARLRWAIQVWHRR